MKLLFIFGIACAVVLNGLALPVEKHGEPDLNCGYKTCHLTNPDKINVHLVPHSHDDVGWLQTYDEYYYGFKVDGDTIGVQYIISSVIQALKNNPQRKFIQVESAFLWKWWKEHRDTQDWQDLVDLVNKGQIEMVSGGWSMNDEGATNYQSIIDQMTYGNSFLKDQIGECARPRVAWQIDPFGHSKEQALMFNKMGFDGIMFARLDYRDRARRRNASEYDLLWKSSDSLDDSTIFTSMFPEFYTSPNNFCWDPLCQADPIVDDEESPNYNLKQKVEDFTKFIKDHINAYSSNNILVPMGGDFEFQNANMYYTNIDRLIRGFTKFNDTGLNLFYSTPSCYVKAVNDALAISDKKLTVKTDDFFPYASDDNTYWSGYFSTRPNFKRLERAGNNFLQAAKQLSTAAKLEDIEVDNLLAWTSLSRAMGVIQHHDAITGTAKKHVSDDYTRQVLEAINDLESPAANIYNAFLEKVTSEKSDLDFKFCLLSNVSICNPATEKDSFVLGLYNPLSHPLKNHIVRVAVPEGTKESYAITNVKEFDLVPSIDDFDFTKGEYGDHLGFELVFATEIPALGFAFYQITKTKDPKAESVKFVELTDADTEFKFDGVGFTIDPKSGLLESITQKDKTIKITQELLWYEAAVGDNIVRNDGGSNRSSGAYAFRPAPKTDVHKLYEGDKLPEVTYFKGDIVQEVRQRFNEWAVQIIRIYKEDSRIELDWLVGPLPEDKGEGKGTEVITRFTAAEFDSKDVFYTDSNGRQMMKRVRNKRPDYEIVEKEPIAGNFYPVNSKILIKDEKQKLRLSVLPDRSCAGASLESGQIELLIHRRDFRDDGFGVAQALNDEEFDKGVVARGSQWLILNEEGASSERLEEHNILLRPIQMVASTDKAISIKTATIGQGVEIKDPLNLLTLEPVLRYGVEDQYILRIEHLLEKMDANSQPITLDINSISEKYNVEIVEELTLAAIESIGSRNAREPIQWKTDDKKTEIIKKKDDDTHITINPSEIRTFTIRLVEKPAEILTVPTTTEGNAGVNTIASFGVLILCLLANMY